jgi:hypothetical protein
MVFVGTSAWVVNHRDRGLVRVDTRTNRPKRLGMLPAEVPERIARLGGDLWITGRGTDLAPGRSDRRRDQSDPRDRRRRHRRRRRGRSPVGAVAERGRRSERLPDHGDTAQGDHDRQGDDGPPAPRAGSTSTAWSERRERFG